ncbi:MULTISPECIES: SDR family oxidoreductase [unclassified Variovorax]|uniref:SDR family oxidoreductase n=1 Tax=unclassified Variovorax TaxID=663243 RepID=UPI00076D403B|nr:MULTISPECIES: SDR family oxidoreductase [unclassified Variovorax]KWT75306.1 3-oxoacyl-[acyl-carrier protein] reductase [Variovorax sp. WDL1]PNG51781.1 Bacilysin biosynthesis oxidoreductase YwfH [Variovorax sp. B2]PNG54128.1 Bacilysin biosynthesis oxidoreductase YwfH [Variovorax sp. B4]VTV11604.1 Bacilysin biosynthesis oxidoreductase YwfH [Variovorax sp. WDL1]
MTNGFDLGISGRAALVCGASAGLGKACAIALAQAGVALTLNARNEQTLRECAREIGERTGTTPAFVAADITTAQGREVVLSSLQRCDILVNNAAGPPTGDFMDWSEQNWHEALRSSMVSPIMMMKALLPSMRARGWGRVINITSSSIKAPLPLLGLSNGARSGLAGFVGGLSREIAADGVTINNLLPGRFETGRLKGYIDKLAASQSSSFADAAQRLKSTNPMRRFGRPDEFGAFCAFVASEHAGYLTGQNILLDGGEFPGL